MAKPGEKRLLILQTLATMLENPKGEKITTAALAARLECSEAALYRHFASKAQMYEGLIEFIESSLFGVINQISAEEAQGLQQVEHILALLLNFAERNRGMTRVLTGDALVNQVVEREASPAVQVQRMLAVILQFGEKNPGMSRVMVGDALVFENERLTARMNQFFDRFESQLRQSLRARAAETGSETPTVDAQATASILTSFALGRLQRYARSGFKRLPTEYLDVALHRLAG